MAHRFKREKADAFARLFSSKSELPPEIVDTPFFGEPGIEWQDCIIFRSRNCRRFFKELDGSKATGHGKISAAILKRLQEEEPGWEKEVPAPVASLIRERGLFQRPLNRS